MKEPDFKISPLNECSNEISSLLHDQVSDEALRKIEPYRAEQDSVPIWIAEVLEVLHELTHEKNQQN